MRFTVTYGKGKMEITPLHIERGRQMRAIVRQDVTKLGISFEGSVEALAGCLGIEAEAVKLAIAIANDADQGSPLVGAAVAS